MPERVKTKFGDDTPAAEQPPTKRLKLTNSPQNDAFLHENVKRFKNSESRSRAVVSDAPKKKASRVNTERLKKVANDEQSSGHKTSSRLSRRALELLTVRQRLPIWSQAAYIRAGLSGDKDVLLLVGETGSGKSTQVPQFLVDEDWCRLQKVNLLSDGSKVNVGGCIAITEPRKVAAVSLARRVAEEVGTPLGSSSPSSTVGYHVRFDHSVSSNTKIKFLTEGMLLQEMLRDPWLRQYSAVIVDEVHERSVNVDLILGFLRNIVTGDLSGRGGCHLKVAVMSATADLKALIRFFDDGYIDKGLVEEPLKLTDSMPREQDQTNQNEEDRPPMSRRVSLCRIKGRQFPVKVFYSPSPNCDIVDAALQLVFQINVKEPLPGDILVFLTGQDTVESLEKLIRVYSSGLVKHIPKLLPLPLFSALPQLAQQRVFQQTPPLTRKVIVATNIAETSVTVPGVRHVIDCGKSKIKHFRRQLGLESLFCRPISQSAATQRKGRAGREAPGTCYRLYTEDIFNQLERATVPEILRCDVAQAVLTMKARGVEQPWKFPLLNPPSLKSLSKGFEQLCQLGALNQKGQINETGRRMAKLPLSAPLSRVFLFASQPDFDCLAEMIDIISCLSVEAIFLQPADDESREKAQSARSDLIRREGDHMTLLAALQAYTLELSDRKTWCESRLLSHRAMRGAWKIRKQLRIQAKLMGFGTDATDLYPEMPSPSVSLEQHSSRILKCLLRGFTSRTALLCPDGLYRTCEGKHEITIHPASVLFGKKVEAILYDEFVFTNRSYARNVSVVQTHWINDATMLD